MKHNADVAELPRTWPRRWFRISPSRDNQDATRERIKLGGRLSTSLWRTVFGTRQWTRNPSCRRRHSNRFGTHWKETEAHQWETNTAHQICVTTGKLTDANLNDLCFFRLLSKLVQEHEREIEHSAANKDKFWNLIVEQYHEFHSRKTLERCWDVKTVVTKCIPRKRNEQLQATARYQARGTRLSRYFLRFGRYRRSRGANFGLRRSACLTPFLSPTITCCTSCGF